MGYVKPMIHTSRSAGKPRVVLDILYLFLAFRHDSSLSAPPSCGGTIPRPLLIP